MTTAAVPHHPSAITPEWLTATLQSGGHLRSARVMELVREPLGAGVGFAGSLERLTLSYDQSEAGAPDRLIAKSPGSSDLARLAAEVVGSFEREARFYAALGGDAGIDTPRVYAALWDADSGRSLLLLEDLDQGSFGDQVAGATPEQAALAVEALARFHAHWWNHPLLAEHPWLASTDSQLGDTLADRYPEAWASFAQRFGDRLTPEILAAGPNLGRRLARFLKLIAAMRPPEQAATLSHGDFRADNLFFRTGTEGRPVVAIDWQSVSINPSVGIDLSNFIAGSLTPEQRRRHGDALIERYHAALTATGVPVPALDELRTTCRFTPVFAFAVMIVLANAVDMSTARGVALWDALVERYAAAVTDSGVLAVIPG